MKKLIVAEKPSVARDIARVLGLKGGQEGYIEGEDYIVTWALGHLVTLCEPDEMDERYKKWRWTDLPLLPDDNGVGEVDQRVTVTVNGVNKILVRGQHIKVTVAEYEALHNSGRFDKL
jgi:DNA topoisomerase-3